MKSKAAPLPEHRTKIVATIGPASDSTDMLVTLIRAGMNVARLNFSHGTFEAHGKVMGRIREAEKTTGQHVAIMADLPGPKMRIGKLATEPIELEAGEPFTLSTEEFVGDAHRASVTFSKLPQVVKKGDRLYLNDGLVQLEVDKVEGHEVRCTVSVGGPISSRKGLNLPGIDLGISAFTKHDHACLEFALKAGVDAVSQSFVERKSDLDAVRKAASDLGHQPFVIAKIERAGALTHFDELLLAADGIMVARGDLGVEVPLEQIALTQKDLIARCNLAGKPVITATQMLESMVKSRLPTRAEATDVANAILDGTDALMLSGESATGLFPEEAVKTLVRIAAATEKARPPARLAELRARCGELPASTLAEALATVVEHALETVPFAAVFVPTRSGSTARMISRFKPSAWIVTPGVTPLVYRSLLFSYGVVPVEEAPGEEGWRTFAADWLKGHKLAGERVMLVAGPSSSHPDDNHRIEFISLS